MSKSFLPSPKLLKLEMDSRSLWSIVPSLTKLPQPRPFSKGITPISSKKETLSPSETELLGSTRITSLSRLIFSAELLSKKMSLSPPQMQLIFLQQSTSILTAGPTTAEKENKDQGTTTKEGKGITTTEGKGITTTEGKGITTTEEIGPKETTTEEIDLKEATIKEIEQIGPKETPIEEIGEIDLKEITTIEEIGETGEIGEIEAEPIEEKEENQDKKIGH